VIKLQSSKAPGPLIRVCAHPLYFDDHANVKGFDFNSSKASQTNTISSLHVSRFGFRVGHMWAVANVSMTCGKLLRGT